MAEGRPNSSIFLRHSRKAGSWVESMNARIYRTFGQMQALALLMLAVAMFCGCAQRYKVTLRNHQEIVTSTRPKYDNDTQTYRFKDSSGKEVVLPGFRVKDIDPL